MSEVLAMSIRRPGLVGWQPVDALWFPRDWFDEATSQAQIVRHWQPGARVYRFAEGDVLCFKQATSMACDRLRPWPLVRQGRALCSARLEPAEISALPLADLWLIRDARVQALNLADGVELQPGQWFDIDHYSLLETYDCREVLPEPVLEVWEPQDIHQVLGDVIGAPSAERDVMGKALKAAAAARAKMPAAAAGKSREPRETSSARAWWVPGLAVVAVLVIYWESAVLSPPVVPGQTVPMRVVEASAGGGFDPVWFFLSGAVLTFILWLLRRVLHGRIEIERQALAAQAHKKQAPPTAPADDTPVPERKPPNHRKPSLWRQWLGRMAMASQLKTLLDRRQAAYMQRMLDMFEQGDIAQALRHAIPLDSDQPSAGQAFGAPKPRDELTMGQSRGATLTFNLAEDFQAHLRKLYRQTFERLDRQGRIEEAVYVLAELLHVRQEALDYLEKHQRYQQAAELALTWDSRPAVIVRLLCLAGDWQRALQVARRDRAFAEAVLSLQAQWPQAAERLRLEWADMLVGQGDWLDAVEVIWPLSGERERARQWLLNAEAAGGTLAAAALVKRAVLLPDTLAVYESYVRALRDDCERADERAVLAIELIRVSASSPSVRSMAAAMVHGVLADHAGGHPGVTARDLNALVKLSGDELLKLDMPAGVITPNQSKALQSVIPVPHWSAPSPGSYALYDAVSLRDDNYLVALGESGVAVVDRQGSIGRRFTVPASQLVIGNNCRVALALIQRDSVWRISKLDLVTGTATDLGVLPLALFARRFDGVAWTIVTHGQVRVVDIDRDLATLWHVGDLPGPLVSLEVTADHEYWLLRLPDSTLEQWTYSLPERRLKSRDPQPKPIRASISWQLYCLGEYIECWFESPADDQQELVVNGQNRLRRFRFPEITEDTEASVYADQHWLVTGFSVYGKRRRFHFVNRDTSQLCAILDWPEEETLRIRQSGSDWILSDRQGRLFHVNVATSRLRSLSIH
ncbi:YIP1 family protein [Pseudomonas gingeri NCPPB 3146 = LMG 5327]|uniref:YIP1 family protein n=2 Tax=Pseudomonas gingeri TaxID=117681 RepID=A0A7Y7Y4E8_9PSED|nr:bpX6 domain-containing protein [Pseudomonas gingeri]NVZ27675.1 YIP1 family protein [Pseudomonas gingeri]NWC17509.1 YIP1 family protein [Pseudomonas gingeri]PNQ88105.1 YIP1 family protein [Pseudomonas gingeri NCPPB 3146 = LMG 5327]